MSFDDRRDAGRRLGAQLARTAIARERPVVVALPRGGVPVGAAVAEALGAPLELLAVRKLGAPGNPELAVGAVAEDGTGVLDAEAARRVGMTDSIVRQTMQHAGHELRLQAMRLRRGRSPADVRGRAAIVVDDGLATGLTMLAAVRALRGRGAAPVVVAAPVGSADAVAMLEAEADAVVCHTVSAYLVAVGNSYRDFTQVSEEQVMALVEESRRGPVSDGPRELTVDLGDVRLPADLTMVRGARGLVLIAHGSDSNRRSPRNRAVARALNEAGFATLLPDLLSAGEELDHGVVFDIPLRGRRVAALVRWARADPCTSGLPIGLYGSSTGAAAALRAAAVLGDDVRAVVSRGGRPDLAGECLADVEAPTLLIVGSEDDQVLQLNRRAASVMHCPLRLSIVPGATHLFTEAGTLEAVGELAVEWFAAFLTAPAPAPSPIGGRTVLEPR